MTVTPAQCKAALDVAIADVRELAERLERQGKHDIARAVRRDLDKHQKARRSWDGR